MLLYTQFKKNLFGDAVQWAVYMLFVPAPLEVGVGSDWSLEHRGEGKQASNDRWRLPRNFKQSSEGNNTHARVQITYHRCQY